MTMIHFVLAVGLVVGVPGLAVAESNRDAELARDEVEFGIVAAQHGLWDEATFRFERAIALDPEYAEAFNDLAVAYEQTGRFDDAERMYQRALALDRGDSDIRTNYELFTEIVDRVGRPRVEAHSADSGW
jgi:Flp pilus assembly protein TadD